MQLPLPACCDMLALLLLREGRAAAHCNTGMA
jgi:hypothetical protein